MPCSPARPQAQGSLPGDRRGSDVRRADDRCPAHRHEVSRACDPAGQTSEGVDANVLRTTRLIRLFNEQVETMAKLKGKGGQQRAVVEHVTVAAGGQAIVGSVTRGWGAFRDERG